MRGAVALVVIMVALLLPVGLIASTDPTLSDSWQMWGTRLHDTLVPPTPQPIPPLISPRSWFMLHPHHTDPARYTTPLSPR